MSTIVVTDDGEIETIEWKMVMTETDYEELKNTVEYLEYDAVYTWIGEESTAAESGIEAYTGSDEQTDSGYEVIIEYSEIDVSEYEKLSVTTDDRTLTVEGEGLDEDDWVSESGWDEITNIVVMPGEVTDSNAYEVDGETAIWHLHEEDPGDFYVQASIDEESDETEDEGDTDDEDNADHENMEADDEMAGGDDESGVNAEDADDDGLPGFGLITAVVGVAVGTFLFARRSR